ncbi:hypothetical protein F8388_020271 [Cannabis sativa]|uniref:Disease resistance R13L4/SHOC-2-like LRR domain-containing protein n=1 Tax=Cannabis sativa TaxID=3483 RepID=A0A7J6FY95_CANSA|nr:hypothetical protein F8388_020271 [Cannabis sativa]
MSDNSSNKTSNPKNSANPPTKTEKDVSPKILIDIVRELKNYVETEAHTLVHSQKEIDDTLQRGDQEDQHKESSTTTTASDPKKVSSSWCDCVRKHKPADGEGSKAKTDKSGGEGSTRRGCGSTRRGGGGIVNRDPDEQIKKMEINLEQMANYLSNLENYEKDFKKKIEDHQNRIELLFKNIKEMKDESSKDNNDDENKYKYSIGNKLWDINKEITKLKHRIPSSFQNTTDHEDESQKKTEETTTGPNTQIAVDELLSLYTSKSFTQSSLHEEIERIYNGDDLEENEKKCLLCFAVFTENEELTKRMLTYWWAGEGYIQDDPNKMIFIEEAAGKILAKFTEKHLIEPVFRKRWSIAKSYKMQPIIRSVIVQLAAKENFFAYDDDRNLKARSPNCQRICLVKQIIIDDQKDEKDAAAASKPQPDQPPTNPKDEKDDDKDMSAANVQPQQPPRPKDEKDDEKNIPAASNSSNANARPQQPPKPKDEKDDKKDAKNENYSKEWETNLETIFNVDEPFPDLRLEWLAKGRDKKCPTEDEKRVQVEEWLSKMKALKVLYLGTWRASGKHHIEVDNIEFLKALKSMSSLRLLSLQGISRIIELKDSMKGLTKLTVLDLKACHNLEELPKEISYLQSLTHLDVSDCYMIDHMPRELSKLTNLQVLKGFVIGKDKNQSKKFCAFENLDKMKKLRTLSLFISRKDFPSAKDLKTFGCLEGLKRLTLSWGADNNATSGTDSTASKKKKGTNTETASPFSHLEKLDLQCYPHETTPNWLKPEKLGNLKKLYIRGGKLGGDLWYSNSKNDGNNESLLKNTWSVETLRLKFLAGLKLDWEEMKEFFPKLCYLEKIDCPLVTMCPCDADGVWVSGDGDNQQPQQSK